MDRQESTIAHLQSKVNDILPEFTRTIQEMNKRQELEKFLQRVFKFIPNVTSSPTGLGWGTDHGTDLLIEFKTPITRMDSPS